MGGDICTCFLWRDVVKPRDVAFRGLAITCSFSIKITWPLQSNASLLLTILMHLLTQTIQDKNGARSIITRCKIYFRPKLQRKSLYSLNENPKSPARQPMFTNSLGASKYLTGPPIGIQQIPSRGSGRNLTFFFKNVFFFNVLPSSARCGTF